MSELELLKDFYTNVKAMREAQRAYFKTRSDYALSQAKNLEYEVDKTIGVLDDTGQGDLFSEEPARAYIEQRFTETFLGGKKEQ